MSYGDLMNEYARQRGLKRLMLPVPVLTPTLSALWIHLISPVPASIALPLTEGLSTWTLRRAVRTALDRFGTEVSETLSAEMLDHYEYPGIRAALDRAVRRGIVIVISAGRPAASAGS